MRDYPPISLYGEEISKKKTTKFLGMTLHRKLDWRARIAAVKGETLRALNIIFISQLFICLKL